VPFLTLLSDYGSASHEPALIKGDLWGTHPALQIVDITHQVNRFDASQAAFLLADVLRAFPSESVHLVCVNAAATEKAPHRCARVCNQWVIAADRPFFQLLQDDLGGEEMSIFNLLPPVAPPVHPNFPEREVFVPVARSLLDGLPIEAWGSRTEAPRSGMRPAVRVEGNALFCQVIYVDGFENAVTNLDWDTFENARQGRNFRIHLRGSRMDIRKVSARYDDVPAGERLALFNHRGLLEIAIAHHAVPGHFGGASSLLGLPVGHSIQIAFE
jgi:S-adenosylmethionine hydrolase